MAPGSLAVIYEDMEILFKPLVCAFRLAISLGVISGAYVLFDIQNTAKFSGELGSEVGVSISDDFAGGTIVWENMLDIEVGDIECSGCFVAGNEDGGF